jgi:hypothetical protein
MEKRFKLHLYFFCWVSQSGVAMVAILISPPNNQKKKKTKSTEAGTMGSREFLSEKSRST